MKKIILILAAAVFCTTALNAVPAWPGRIIHTQPDGSTIALYKHGDEHAHWLTDTEGRIVRKDPDGFYRVSFGESAAQAAAAARLRRAAARRSARMPEPEHIAFGRKHFLVVLVEFQNLSFTVDDPRTAFHNLLNQTGYSRDGATGSARDYYYDNSHGRFEPVFDVYGPVKVSRNYEYYGANDRNGWDEHPEQALSEALRKIDPDVDFSLYDNDSDGTLDLAFMYYAGYGEAEVSDENTIWPHQGGFYGLTLDGIEISSYACTCELKGYGSMAGQMCAIGAACHEFAHAMGLPDFYDTDYEDNGSAGGLYDFSLMDGGCYNNDSRTPPYLNMIERIMLGWLTDDAIIPFNKPGRYVIPPVNENVAYMTPTDMAGEFFMYECRAGDGWDSAIGGEGLVVYHVDQSDRMVPGADMSAGMLWDYWQSYNSINAYGIHPCFLVIPSSDQNNLNYSGSASRMTFPGKADVTGYTPRSWSGHSGDYVLSDISYASGAVALNIDCPEVHLGYAVISNPGNGVYTAGSTFSFELEDRSFEPAERVTWTFDGALVSGDPVVLTPGRHTVEAAIITTASGTYTVSLEIEVR